MLRLPQDAKLTPESDSDYALFDANLCKNILSLSTKNITDSQIPSLISYLSHHREITVLDLRNNKITNKSANLLAAIKTLKTLNLQSNLLDESCYIDFENNDTLTKLDIADNHLTEENFRILKSIIRRNIFLQNLPDSYPVTAWSLFTNPLTDAHFDFRIKKLYHTCRKSVIKEEGNMIIIELNSQLSSKEKWFINAELNTLFKFHGIKNSAEIACKTGCMVIKNMSIDELFNFLSPPKIIYTTFQF